MREWSLLCNKLKLTVSLRAALKRRTGNETRPKVRWPFHTLDAICEPQSLRLSRYYKARYHVKRPLDVNEGCKGTYASRRVCRQTPVREHPRASPWKHQQDQCQLFLCPASR